MEYNRLKDTAFPDISTVDPFASQTDFDYSRYDDWQMHIRVLSVPWDLGSVHVGQSVITGVGNVVKFIDDADRDAWFADKRYAASAEQFAQGGYDGIEWYTRFRRYHDQDEIRLELPFNTLSRFNYIYIEYMPAPSAENPVNYETGEQLKWLYFLRGMRYEAVNCTIATIMLDYWQTYINRMHIPYMLLARGHAPMAKISADDFLQSPIDNNQYLLAEDVSFADASVVKHSASAVLNANDMQAVIFTTADPRGDFGTLFLDWKTPGNGSSITDGLPSPTAFCLPAASISGMLAAIDSQLPQFKQTIQAIGFVSSDLLYMGDAFTFCGYACRLVWGSGHTYNLLSLAKSQFGYDARYADLAKLYTAPYAHIEIVSADGGATRLAIEDCDNALQIFAHAQMAFPFINIDTRLSGAGGAGGTVTFGNAATESFAFDGRWYEYAQTWQVPTFSVIQDAGTANNYATHFDRLQQAYAADQAKANANESASTSKTNADNSANTAYDNATAANSNAKTNADKIADNQSANTTLETAAATTITARNNMAITNNAAQDQNSNTANTRISNDYIDATTNDQIDATLQSSAVSAVGSVAGAISGAVAGASAGGAGGAIAGALGGIVQAGTSIAQGVISSNLTTAQAANSKTANSDRTTTANTVTTQKGAIQQGVASDNNQTTTNLATATTANNVRVSKEVSANDKTTNDAIALDTKNTAITNNSNTKTTADNIANRNRNIVTNAIANQIAQKALDAPVQFGSASNGLLASQRPIATFANVVTQPKSAIRRAGDYFLRWGYAYDGAWELEDLNVMPRFTYWECSDLWMSGLDMPDEHVDQIRFLLMGGVTVWRRPEYIGNTSIYDNM